PGLLPPVLLRAAQGAAAEVAARLQRGGGPSDLLRDARPRRAAHDLGRLDRGADRAERDHGAPRARARAAALAAGAARAPLGSRPRRAAAPRPRWADRRRAGPGQDRLRIRAAWARPGPEGDRRAPLAAPRGGPGRRAAPAFRAAGADAPLRLARRRLPAHAADAAAHRPRDPREAPRRRARD